MEIKQLIAVFGPLSFLGTVALTAAAILGIVGSKLIGEKRLARFSLWCADWLFAGRGLAAKIGLAAIVLILGYSATLFGASLASQELTLPPGAEKYFCEIDCHLAYSVTDAKTAAAIGADSSAVKAQGRFVIVAVRTRFDKTAISRHRGNGPLVPSPREVTLLDSAGQSYAVSEAGQQALVAMGESGVSMMQPLRPGESYVSRLVFDLPVGITNLRLLIASPSNPRWISTVIIGDEESVWHKKVLLALGPAPTR
ncbi:MAG: hypothetical protein WAM91_00720 [Candidatus Acidiferrales bacterium]